MKQTYCFFSTFAHRVLTAASARAKLLTAIALCLFSVGNIWGETETLTISGASVGNNAPWGSTYSTNNGTSSTSTGTSVGISWTRVATMSSCIQIEKGTSKGFHSTSVPDNAVITSITITKKTNNVNLYVSKDGTNWGTATSISATTTKKYSVEDGYKFFKVTATSSYAQISSISVTYESAPSYTITAVTNPTGGGSVFVEGNKITAMPNTGWQISTTNPYTVTDGTATVEQSGNEFTVTPSSDCTVQINFEKEQTYTLTYQIGNDIATKELPGGTNILSELPASATSCDATSTAFIGWIITPINGKQPTCPQLIAEDATITTNMTVYAVFAKAEGGTTEVVEDITDVLTREVTGVPSQSQASYQSWSKKKITSEAMYSGNSAGANNSITLRVPTKNTQDDSGIISTTSGGKLKKVVVEWNTNTTDGRTLYIYGNIDPYSSVSDLYDPLKQGANVGQIVCGTSTEYILTDTQRSATNYVGLRSQSGAMYLKSIKIVWEKSSTGSSTTYTDYMTACEECEELGATWETMQATNVVRQTATLSWGMSSTEHVTGYSVHVRSTSSTVYDKTFTVEEAATTTLDLTDLWRETTYKWTVTAITESGWCTTTSEEQSFETIGAEKLPAPGNPKVVYNPETDDYTFSWDEVTGVKEYKMTGQFSGTIKGTSFTRTLDLIPGKEYTVTVQAIGDGDNYTNSETASVTFTAHTYTLTLSVTDNGTPTTTTFTQPQVTLPAETSMCEISEGWTFAGWSETDITEESTTTAPALIPAGTEYGPDGGYIKKDRTLFAVFSKTEEGVQSNDFNSVDVDAGDLVSGADYILTALSDDNSEYAFSTSAATTGKYKTEYVYVNGIDEDGNNETDYYQISITQTHSDGAVNIVWTLTGDAINGYTFTHKSTGKYLINNAGNLSLSNTGTPAKFLISHPSSKSWKVDVDLKEDNTTKCLAAYRDKSSVLFNLYGSSTFDLYLYKRISSATLYTTSPQCTDCNDPNNKCPEYPLVLNDREVETTMDSYWVGKQISEPVYTPQGECAGYWFDGWTTEEGLSNLTATEWASKKIQFPYKMPKKAATDGKLTLYAVYRSTLTDEYRLVTDMSELTTGEYVIAYPYGGKENALSFVRKELITEFGSEEVTPTVNEDGNDIIQTTDQRIIWTVTEEADGYTLEALHFDEMKEHSYLNISDQYMLFEETAKPYAISQISAYNNTFSLCAAAEGGACMVYNGTGFEAGGEASSLHLYKRVQDIRYSTSTHCDPSVISVGTVAVTSAQGIWVEAVTQPYVYAERLTQNRDRALVDIIASTAKSSPFTLKAVDATGVGDHSITLVSGETRDNFAGRFKVVYTPKQTGGIDKDNITVKVTKAGDPATVYATHTFEVQGRSLPGEFVIAAQTADGWVALPADLGNSSLAYLKAPYSIEVDNEADPTKARQAPQTAVYHAAERFDEDTNLRSVRLLNSRNESLCGDYSKDPDHRLWFDGGKVKDSQSWALRSLALKDYYIRLQAAPAGHYLFYNATTGGGKIGYYEYKQQNRLRLRLLPVETTCVRYDAPDLQVGQLKSTSVTLEWPKIQNATGYEYSLNRGTTWIPFVQGTDWTVENGMNIGTIDGLAAETRYTVWVRVAVGESENNCSEVGVRTFTMPECDDAPHNLWASATADAVTVVWEAASPTATVKIYSDEDGTTLFKEQESGATENHQCRITGLEQNTKYWYQVFSAGTCGSAIASFTTESKDISIVEWKKDEVLVDINTEIGEGVDFVVQKRQEHGEHNYADDLFFSKYYEATGDVKLLGIYNGTPNTVSLSGYKIYIGKKEGEKIGQWDYTVDLSTIGDGVIEPNEEILLWRHIASDNTQVECIEGKIDVKNMIENSSIIFGGRNAIVLSKDNVPIDVMGGISEGETMDDILPANCTHEKPSWGDQSSNTSWNGWGYSIEDPTQKIELSMNRCLLVRRNHVKSGKNAVEKNRGIAGFLTLGNEEGVESEWLGRQVPKGNNDWKVSCEGFSYVADFDYSNYYVTYDKVEEAKFNGTPNENGTYTIKVPDLPQLACTDIRLQLTKNGEVTASVEQKVPIIVTEDANTTDALFSANGLTPEICKTCDVVVRDKSRLTHATGQNDITEFRNMFIYHDSELEIAVGTSLRLDKLRMFALNDSVSYAIINNTNDADNPTITVNEVSHVKRIDGRYWYPFSLPYNCDISEISALNGKSLGKYGTDWCIKYYDGEQRQKDGTSAAIGQVSQYWEKLGESDMLEAYKGYIIGLYCPTADTAHQKSVNFAPARQIVYTETDASKTTYVHNWPDNLEAAEAEARHHGWNFTGSPYISLFGVNERGDGLFNDQLKMGYTDELTGAQLDKKHVYLSIPDGKDTRTYTQVLASATTVKPFTAYFVQTIDPTDGMGHTLQLTYQKARRTFPVEESNPTLAPRRAAERDAVLFAEINLTDNAAGGQDTYLRDNTGVLVSDRFSAGYEIGDDLTKMYAAAGKPQLYTMAGNEKMAYNALPDGLAHNLPLGIYVPKAGEYTLSLNRHASRLENAEAVYLLHSGLVVADLLLSDYTILATAKGEQTGYMLDIRRATKVVTGTEQIATDEPYAIMRDGQLTIGNLPTASDVAIYDALGRLVWSEQQATTPVVADLPQTGVYMVLITSGEQQYVLKSLNR